MSEENGIQDLLGLEKPLTKLIECVSAGVGKAYEPVHIKRMAKARQDEIKLIGEALSDNISLPSKYEDGKITIDTTEVEELIKRTSNRVLYKELRKQQNIESVIAETYNLLENEEYVTGETVNQDWLYKFFDDVGEISDEYMQKIWAKILAGEIKEPNTYTIRTLNTLKNLTKKEALLFNNLTPYIIFHGIESLLYHNSKLFEKYGINFDDLLILEDCGLINLNGFITMTTDKSAVYTPQLVLTFDGELRISIFTLNESGKQIINLIKNEVSFNNEYFLDICKELKEENKNINFHVYRVKSIENNNLDFDETEDLLQENNLITV